MLSTTTFIFKTLDDKNVIFQKEATTQFPKVILEDSIFTFYTYAEINMKDIIGMVPDFLFFVEGLKFNIQIGNKTDGFLSSNYCWSEHQIPETEAASYLAGSNVFIMKSAYFADDIERTRAWNDTIINVVKDVVYKDFNLTSTTKPQQLFTSLNTTGVYKHYQFNITTQKFLKTLASKAYTQNFSKSPFFTFFNCAGEFYFMSLSELMNQPSVASYTLNSEMDRAINPNSIHKITAASAGLPVNKFNYEQDCYVLNSSGAYEKEDIKLQDYFIGNQREKFLLQKQKQRKMRNTYLGLINKQKERDFYQGILNNLFIDSMCSNRLEVLIYNNSKVTSGKTIDLTIGSGLRKEKTLKELSGKWLIIGAKHYMDKDAVPFSKLELAKPGIEITPDNKYYKEFLGK